MGAQIIEWHMERLSIMTLESEESVSSVRESSWWEMFSGVKKVPTFFGMCFKMFQKVGRYTVGCLQQSFQDLKNKTGSKAIIPCNFDSSSPPGKFATMILPFYGWEGLVFLKCTWVTEIVINFVGKESVPPAAPYPIFWKWVDTCGQLNWQCILKINSFFFGENSSPKYLKW